MKSYDLHVHTKYSRCSLLEPAAVLKILKKKGYNGVAITDHNTIKGAIATKKLNKDKNFEVVVGEEIRSFLPGRGHCHILGFYLNKEIKPAGIFEVVDEINSQGGLACIAHPFTEGIRANVGGRQQLLRQLKKKLVALECFNARNPFAFLDEKARQDARKLNLAMTSGSDGHFAFELGSAATKFDGRLGLRDALKKRKTIAAGGTRFFAYAGHFFSPIFKNARKLGLLKIN